MSESGSYFDQVLTTERQLWREGLSEAFANEALEKVQNPFFSPITLFAPPGESSAGKAPSPLGDHDEKVTTYAFGNVFQRGVLDMKTQAMLVLSGLIVLRRTDVVRVWINASLNSGWGEDAVRELIIWSCFFGGFPIQRDATFQMVDIFQKRRANPELKMA